MQYSTNAAMMGKIRAANILWGYHSDSIKQTHYILQWICSAVDHERSQKVVRANMWHKTIGEHAIDVFHVFCGPAITEQAYGKMEFIYFIQ